MVLDYFFMFKDLDGLDFFKYSNIEAPRCEGHIHTYLKVQETINLRESTSDSHAIKNIFLCPV